MTNQFELNIKEIQFLLQKSKKKNSQEIPLIAEFLSDKSKLFFKEEKKLLPRIQQISILDSNPLQHYWLSQLKKWCELQEEILQYDDTQIDDPLFDYWTNSEFAKNYFQGSKKNSIERSSKCLKIFAEQLCEFYDRHLATHLKQKSKKYSLISEIGENQPVKIFITPHLYLMTDSQIEAKKQKKRILKALERLKLFYPEGHQRFCMLTHQIISTKDESIVSFSSQDLPGFSTINLTHRDDIDLLDDLIHENGHHHLNRILDINHLIKENSEAIFYSPWRKTPRPIRGIYHGYFTFYWALDLFYHVLIHPDSSKHFSQQNIQKMQRRFKEEFIMLRSSELEIEKARKLKLINKKGMMLAKTIEGKIDEKQSLYEKLKGKK